MDEHKNLIRAIRSTAHLYRAQADPLASMSYALKSAGKKVCRQVGELVPDPGVEPSPEAVIAAQAFRLELVRWRDLAQLLSDAPIPHVAGRAQRYGGHLTEALAQLDDMIRRGTGAAPVEPGAKGWPAVFSQVKGYRLLANELNPVQVSEAAKG